MAINDAVIGSELANEFDQGIAEANLISIKWDGVTVSKSGAGVVSAAQASLTYNNATTELTFAAPGQAPSVINLSALTTDIYVNGGTFDATTGTLTLTDNDAATPDVTVDLSAFAGVSADANNLLTDGSDNKPFLNCAAISATCTGVVVSRFGTPLFRAFPL